jgi:hypothetical protein
MTNLHTSTPFNLTKEQIKQLNEESKKWREEFQKYVDDIENITADDLRTIIK